MKKVVIVDELRQLVDKERSFLNRSGIRIMGAASNKDILQQHRAHKADLIVAMLRDKSMSGEKLCATIRDDEELRTVSILLVCSSSEADHELCLGCRANAFITMPVSPAVLLQEAHHLLHIAPREALRTEIDVMLRLSSGRLHYPGRSENISESGMLIASQAEIHEGDNIGCTFELPGYGRVSVTATVVRASIKEGGDILNRYGIAFNEPSREMVYAIKVFIRKQRGS